MTVPPLRILHLNSLLQGGGTDDQCLKLVQGLHQLGQKVWLAGPTRTEWGNAVQSAGIPFHPTPPEGPVKLRLILDAARFIRRQRIQIVHGHHGRDIWPAILAGRLSGLKPSLVLTRHLAKSPSSWFSRRFLLSQCDALIAVSQFVAQVLRAGVYEPASPNLERRARPPLRGNHNKIRVIYGGIDTARFQPRDASEQRRLWGLEPQHYAFAVVGSYDLPRGKGQREFLQAAARIHQSLPSARFLIVGRGNMADLLNQEIEHSGLTGKAWLTPYCHDMVQAMNALDCLVHPQVGTEALGLVVCEALACGKPVIASRLDGIPEAFAAGNYGDLVAPESIECLADAMSRWAVRPALNPDQRQALHQRVKAAFSLDRATARVLELYQRLVAV